MAKTKLIIKIGDELDKYKAIFKQAKETINQGKYVDPDATQHALDTQYAVVNAAIHALEEHFKDLHRREGNPKVTDRLRNLKNVFKDKAALANNRRIAEDLLEKNVKLQVAEAQQKANKVVQKLIKLKPFWGY
jgi:ribosomal protein S15P/S13E